MGYLSGVIRVFEAGQPFAPDLPRGCRVAVKPNLTFPTQTGKTYTVQYKNLLTAPTWSTLTTTNGTGVNAVVSDPVSGSQRYYRLSVQ